MKKVLVLLLATIGMAAASQAVVVHWAVSDLGSFSPTVAELVYVAGSPSTPYYAGYTLQPNGPGNIVGTLSGPAITPDGIGEQDMSSTFSGAGNYYVILIDWSTYSYKVSGPLSSSDPTITSSEFYPINGVWDPSGTFTDGTVPIPEPATMSLLCVGAATLAIRRRRKRLA